MDASTSRASTIERVYNFTMDTIIVRDSVILRDMHDTIYLREVHRELRSMVDVQRDTIRDTIMLNQSVEVTEKVQERPRYGVLFSLKVFGSILLLLCVLSFLIRASRR